MTMLCANPDIEVVDKSDHKMRWRNRRALRDLGRCGHLSRQAACRRLPPFTGATRPAGKPNAHGRDNRATDIAGANATGLDSLLLADGIDAQSYWISTVTWILSV